MAKSFDGTILLYHGAFETVPPAIDHRFHNVDPDTLYAQLRWLKANFDVVSLDAFLARDDRSGCVALTLDDGYASAIGAFVPLLETMDLSATAFVNADMLDGGVFWRDMVRNLIATGREEAFLGWASGCGFERARIGRRSFYMDSKSARINSLQMRDLLVSFFEEAPPQETIRFTAARGELPDNERLSYASHTGQHAVLSSLRTVEVEREIAVGLAAVVDLKFEKAGTSRALALPFGSPLDYDERVFGVAAAAGHSSVLLAGTGLGIGVYRRGSLTVANRTTAPTTLTGLQSVMAHTD